MADDVKITRFGPSAFISWRYFIYYNIVERAFVTHYHLVCQCLSVIFNQS